MSFELDPAEPLPGEVRRVAAEQLEDARRRLDNETGEAFDLRIHHARKRTKEVRALLRLVRADLGEKAYRRENKQLRNTSRTLAAVRDARVRCDVAQQAAGDLGQDVASEAAAVLSGQLRSEKARAAQARVAQQAAAQLSAATARVADWPLEQDRWRAVRPGLQRSYAAACDGFAVAAKGRDDDVHGWRKRTKDHWHHLQLLRAAWPAVLDAYAAEAHRLSGLLGDHHDLTLFIGCLEGLGLDAHAHAVLGQWADQRQQELLAEAVDLGGRVYAEPPKAMTARISGLSKRVRRQQRAL